MKLTLVHIHQTITGLLTLATIFLLWKNLAIPGKPENNQTYNKAEIEAIFSELALVKEREKGKRLLEKKEQSYELATTAITETLHYGAADARVTLQVFSDIECPICKMLHPSLKRIVDSSQGIINWEHRHFPLSMHNPTAAIESQVVECVKESYNNRVAWVFLDLLFEETKGNGKGVESLPELSRAYGLSGTLIENCIASDSHKEKINADYELGKHFGISATPAIRIVDNSTQKSVLLKGYKTQEQLLAAIKHLLDS
jgi:protein-disulfide isomerase